MTIKEWLNSNPKDYWQGVELYSNERHNKALLNWYRLGKNSVSLQSLIEELRKVSLVIEKSLVSVNTPVLKTTSKKPLDVFTKKKREEPRGFLPSDKDDAPEEVKRMVARRKILFLEVNRLHAVISRCTNDLERAVLAIQIVESWDEIEKLWRKTNYYDNHLSLPVELPTVEIQIKEGESLVKRLQTLRSYRSKCQKGILSADRLPSILAEIESLELLIESSEDVI